MVVLTDSEQARLKALFRFKILDTEKEEFYNSIINLTAAIMGVPFASIAFVDSSRLWFKASYGFDMQEVPREHTFCSQVIKSCEEALIVKDATQDSRFCNNPYVTGQPNVRFYFGEPLITSDNQIIGVLCGTDVCARVNVTKEQMESMKTLSKLIMSQLELREFLIGVHENFEQLNELFTVDESQIPIMNAYQELNDKCDSILERLKARKHKK